VRAALRGFGNSCGFAFQKFSVCVLNKFEGLYEVHLGRRDRRRRQYLGTLVISNVLQK
jgi:hypothetical protein